MKFHLLPVGTRFRYDNRLFTKNAPLTATDEQGNQRMIPRSTNVEPVQEAPPAGVRHPVRDRLVAAAEKYHRICSEQLTQLAESADPARASQVEAALEAAREDFLRNLEDAIPQE